MLQELTLEAINGSQFKNKPNDFEWFPLALCESTNVTDTIQLLFIKGANAEFENAEKLASVNSLLGTTTTCENIFKKVEKTLTQYTI